MDKLLEILKRKLKITWDDNDTNNRINDILKSAMSIMMFKLGMGDKKNFESAGLEQNLLINYCMYEWNNCVNEFDKNYFNEIMQCRCKYEV